MHVDWDDLMADSSNAPNINVAMNVDADTLTLNVDVTADFVGWASADHNTPGYGMMYIIDFETPDVQSMNIQQLGTCANRNQQSRAMQWEDNWLYSAEPDRGVDWGHGAYVGSRYWDITTADNGDCGGVKWTGSWTWYDLLNCTNYAGDRKFMDIHEDSEWVNMTGTVNVNLVSPLMSDFNTGTQSITLSDDEGFESNLYVSVLSVTNYIVCSHHCCPGFYRMYQLMTQPFSIVVHKASYQGQVNDLLN